MCGEAEPRTAVKVAFTAAPSYPVGFRDAVRGRSDDRIIPTARKADSSAGDKPRRYQQFTWRRTSQGFGRPVSDKPVQDPQTPIAAFTRPADNGKSRTLTPAASRNALAIAAAIGPCPASPVPRNG